MTLFGISCQSWLAISGWEWGAIIAFGVHALLILFFLIRAVIGFKKYSSHANRPGASRKG